MYTPRIFTKERPKILRATTDRIALATLVTVGSQIGASQVPLIWDKSEDRSDILVGHLARANNQWKDCDGNRRSLDITAFSPCGSADKTVDNGTFVGCNWVERQVRADCEPPQRPPRANG
jgi:hypothetical protein